MFKLTTICQRDGKKALNDFEATTKAQALASAARFHSLRDWEIYNIKKIVSNAAGQTQSGTTDKVASV